uniref:Uncharacterized protein n=1 Tax=Tanacetum cinerariifolium TaxID=118510 RepID=A0A6L2MAF7_TANCI|nr:hypothetical protein [Tanacetum cinerariifolium]
MDSDDAVEKKKVLEEPDSTNVEVKQEGDEESIRKRPGRRLKMKATKKYKRREGSVSVGFITTQQMVISSPCLTDIEANGFCKELASPKQTALALAILDQMATGKETSNPFMAGSLPKTT